MEKVTLFLVDKDKNTAEIVINRTVLNILKIENVKGNRNQKIAGIFAF